MIPVGEIKIAESVVKPAATEFSATAHDIRSLKHEVGVAESSLFGAFEGDAAQVTQELLSVLDTCIGSLADSYETHSVSLDGASRTFQDVDQGLAASRVRGGSGGSW